MEILGIGTWELAAILLIMLVVAGPKRMIHWAYQMGQYAAKLKGMWAEVMAVVQKEVDAAGMDIKVPTSVPTRGSLNRTINRTMTEWTRPVTSPIQETMQKARAATTVTVPAKPPEPVVEPAAPADPTFGTWSQTDQRMR